MPEYVEILFMWAFLIVIVRFLSELSHPINNDRVEWAYLIPYWIGLGILGIYSFMAFLYYLVILLFPIVEFLKS